LLGRCGTRATGCVADPAPTSSDRASTESGANQRSRLEAGEAEAAEAASAAQGAAATIEATATSVAAQTDHAARERANHVLTTRKIPQTDAAGSEATNSRLNRVD